VNHENVLGTPDKKSKTTTGNRQRKSSLSLFIKSLLDTIPFAILDSDENNNDLSGKESRNINANQFNKINQSGKNIPKPRIPPITITKVLKNPKKQFPTYSPCLKGMLTLKS